MPPLGGTGPGAASPRLDSSATQLGAQCPDLAQAGIKASSVQLWAAAGACAVRWLTRDPFAKLAVVCVGVEDWCLEAIGWHVALHTPSLVAKHR